MHIHLHYLFAKTVNYFKKSDRQSENPTHFIYCSDSRKETVWIYIGRIGFTLFRRFRRFRRAELHAMYSTKISSEAQLSPSRKLLRIKVTPDLHLTYSKNGGNLGLVLKMKTITCISILLTKHVKYTYLYLFKFV